MLGLPAKGRIDTRQEILTNSYAVAFDAINSNLLTETPQEYDNRTVKEIVARFSQLKRIASKSPQVLHALSELETCTIRHHRGQISSRVFLIKIRSIASRFGLSQDLINQVEARVAAFEMQPRRKPAFPFMAKLPTGKTSKLNFFGNFPLKSKPKHRPLGLLDTIFMMNGKKRRGLF